MRAPARAGARSRSWCFWGRAVHVLTYRTERRRTLPPVRLERFEPHFAELVASWVRSEREAYWLAPHTPPPITAERVVAWSVAGRHPLQLMEAGMPVPVAYGELNVLNAAGREYWLGHLIVDCTRRGRGLGVRLVELLIERGFQRLGARRISLVVFTDNLVAQRSYRAAGMRDEGYEVHHFPAYGTSERLLRMAIEDWMQVGAVTGSGRASSWRPESARPPRCGTCAPS